MNNSITVQIGNSDDKLLQAGWAAYVNDVGNAIGETAFQIHFSGYSHPVAPWQNAAWCFDISPMTINILKRNLSKIADQYHQDSIAWLAGETEFIKPAGEADAR